MRPSVSFFNSPSWSHPHDDSGSFISRVRLKNLPLRAFLPVLIAFLLFFASLNHSLSLYLLPHILLMTITFLCFYGHSFQAPKLLAIHNPQLLQVSIFLLYSVGRVLLQYLWDAKFCTYSSSYKYPDLFLSAHPSSNQQKVPRISSWKQPKCLWQLSNCPH